MTDSSLAINLLVIDTTDNPTYEQLEALTLRRFHEEVQVLTRPVWKSSTFQSMYCTWAVKTTICVTILDTAKYMINIFEIPLNSIGILSTISLVRELLDLPNFENEAESLENDMLKLSFRRTNLQPYMRIQNGRLCRKYWVGNEKSA
jgi:hypothetical protein